jgi:alpha 1,3-glucosidase
VYKPSWCEQKGWRRYFTWDQHLFPDPEKLQEDVASHGRKTVTIIDPHIKRDPGYYIYQEAEKGGYFVKDKDGKDFDG